MGDRVLSRVVMIVALCFAIVAVPAAFSLEPGNGSTYFPYEGAHTATLEQQQPADPVGSASGDVLYLGNGSSKDVYVKLGDATDLGYALDMGPLEQGVVTIDVPVNWTQHATVTTNSTVTVNLWNHNDSIPASFLSDVQAMQVVLNGEVISEVPIFQVEAGTWNLTIHYQTPAVHREVICENETVQDLLPSGAQLINSDLPVDTMVQQVCHIRLYHTSHTPYRNVHFDMPEIDRQQIVSIYSVEQDTYLYLKNDSLYVPRP